MHPLKKIKSELSPENYRRVAIINLLMSFPLFGLFAWIGFTLTYFHYRQPVVCFVITCLFAFPMMLTLLHGHVTMAIGASQRDSYYQWLSSTENKLGLLFHPLFISTKFRISGLILFSAVQVILFLLF